MKRWLIAVSAAALSFSLLAGCGSGTDPDSIGALASGLLGNTASNDSGSAPAPATDTASSSPAPEDETTNTLRSDDDTFHLNMLVQIMQTVDAGVVEMLGEDLNPTYDSNDNIVSRIYEGRLFSHDVRFTISFTDEEVTGIDIDFDGSDASLDQFAASITEALGVEPTDGYTWTTETAIVVLEQADGRTIIHMTDSQA